jgi:hypothetical protein
MCLALSGFIGQTLALADALIDAEQHDDIADVDQGFHSRGRQSMTPRRSQ